MAAVDWLVMTIFIDDGHGTHPCFVIKRPLRLPSVRSNYQRIPYYLENILSFTIEYVTRVILLTQQLLSSLL